MPITKLLPLMPVFFLSSLADARNVRQLYLSESDVAEVNTSLGFSTILQFDAHPSSAVLGDQDAFKVEYVGNSLTIKPLVAGAKTNLFVFTDYDRYSFRLKVGPASVVDYIVRVSRRSTGETSPPIPAAVEVTANPVTESYEPPQAQGGLVTRTVGKTTKCAPYQFGLASVAYPKGRPWLILNFWVASTSGKEEALDPSALQVFEAKKPIIIENLYLESLRLPGNGTPVHGTAMLKRARPSALSGIALRFQPPRPGGCSELKITLSTAKAAKGAKHGKEGKN